MTASKSKTKAVDKNSEGQEYEDTDRVVLHNPNTDGKMEATYKAFRRSWSTRGWILTDEAPGGTVPTTDQDPIVTADGKTVDPEDPADPTDPVV